MCCVCCVVEGIRRRCCSNGTRDSLDDMTAKSARLKTEILNTNHVLVVRAEDVIVRIAESGQFDCGNEVFVWKGKRATEMERKFAGQHAEVRQRKKERETETGPFSQSL